MNFLSILLMVIKRIINNINLMLAAVAGLVITVTLVASIPLYSEGMSDFRLTRRGAYTVLPPVRKSETRSVREWKASATKACE